MRLYKSNVTNINIDGEDYPADNQGVIDLPDHLVTSNLFSAGWVDARGHLAQLARAEQAEIKTMPETKSEPPLVPSQDPAAPPVKLMGVEDTDKTTTAITKNPGTGAISTAKIQP